MVSTFRFEMRAAERDVTGYCHTRWDQAQAITVLATTREEAMEKAERVLGEPHRGYCWVYAFDNISEVTGEGEPHD